MADESAIFLAAIKKRQTASLQRFGLRVAVDVDEIDEPIELADAYAHLRIVSDSTGSPDDAWLLAMIPAAREFCEQDLGLALATRTMELATNAFPSVAVDAEVGPCFELPFGPVQSIASVTYLAEVLDSDGQPVLDSDGNAVTEMLELDASAYEIDGFSTPNRLVLAAGQAWPSAINRPNSVKVRYVTGYVPDPESNGYAVLPRTARAAILLMLGHLYENREATTADAMTELPLGVRHLLELVPNRERLGMA